MKKLNCKNCKQKCCEGYLCVRADIKKQGNVKIIKKDLFFVKLGFVNTMKKNQKKHTIVKNLMSFVFLII